MRNLINSLASIMLVIALPGCTDDLPKMDLHVHLTGQSGDNPALRYEKAAALSARMGVAFGIAEEINGSDIKSNDRILQERIQLIKKYPLYLGLQLNGPGSIKLFSKNILVLVDYIMEDALRFPDKDGKIRLLWYPDVVFNDVQDFMDRYIDYNLKVLAEPIDIWVNPTYLPESLQPQYDKLWTEKRMKTLIDVCVKNKIAIEINSRFMIPHKKFIQMAKAAGAHFTFGSNQHDTGIGEIEWSIALAKECRLVKEDFFIPKRVLPKKK